METGDRRSSGTWNVRETTWEDADLLAAMVGGATQIDAGEAIDQLSACDALRVLLLDDVVVGVCGVAGLLDVWAQIELRIVVLIAGDRLDHATAGEAADRLLSELAQMLDVPMEFHSDARPGGTASNGDFQSGHRPRVLS